MWEGFSEVGHDTALALVTCRRLCTNPARAAVLSQARPSWLLGLSLFSVKPLPCHPKLSGSLAISNANAVFNNPSTSVPGGGGCLAHSEPVIFTDSICELRDVVFMSIPTKRKAASSRVRSKARKFQQTRRRVTAMRRSREDPSHVEVPIARFLVLAELPVDRLRFRVPSAYIWAWMSLLALLDRNKPKTICLVPCATRLPLRICHWLALFDLDDLYGFMEPRWFSDPTGSRVLCPSSLLSNFLSGWPESSQEHRKSALTGHEGECMKAHNLHVPLKS